MGRNARRRHPRRRIVAAGVWGGAPVDFDDPTHMVCAAAVESQIVPVGDYLIHLCGHADGVVRVGVDAPGDWTELDAERSVMAAIPEAVAMTRRLRPT